MSAVSDEPLSGIHQLRQPTIVVLPARVSEGRWGPIVRRRLDPAAEGAFPKLPSCSPFVSLLFLFRRHHTNTEGECMCVRVCVRSVNRCFEEGKRKSKALRVRVLSVERVKEQGCTLQYTLHCKILLYLVRKNKKENKNNQDYFFFNKKNQ